MTYCIIFCFGLGLLWTSFKTTDEIYRLALASVGVLASGWGYLFSPALFQLLSGIFILGASQIYISLKESSL